MDEAVVSQVLRVLQPAALEAAALAETQALKQKDGFEAALELELQNARYTVDRARRQYDAVDPSNRLVADELERRWEAALQKVSDLEKRLVAAKGSQRDRRSPSLDQLTTVARDFENVWNAPGTDIALKKRLIRALVEEIVVDIDEDESRINLVIHWKGGIHSAASVRKFRAGERATDLSVDVIAVIRVLARACNDKTIAAFLTRSRVPPATGTRWTWKKVAAARNHHGILPASKQPEGQWLTLTAAALKLGVNGHLLQEAAVRGLITAEQPLPNGPWVFSRDELEKYDATKLRSRLRSSRRKGAPENLKQLNLAISTASLRGAE